MARPGLFNPKNMVEGGVGSFKEGNVRVDSACFRVHHPDVPAGREDRGAHVALIWNVTRLDEDLEPLEDPQTEEPITEELVFSLGRKSLAQFHPGHGDSPDDEEVEDRGADDQTEGNTLYFVNADARVYKNSGIGILMQSLDKGRDKKFPGAGLKPDYLDRIWAPDWVGCTFHMKTWVDEENKIKGNDGVERGIPYKIVTKVLVGPGEAKAKGKGKGAAAGGAKSAAAGKKDAAAAGANGVNAEAEQILTPILEKLSESKDGERLSMKAFSLAIQAEMDKAKVDGKMKIPVMSIYKDDKWLESNAGRFDMTVDLEGRTVTFGELKE